MCKNFKYVCAYVLLVSLARKKLIRLSKIEIKKDFNGISLSLFLIDTIAVVVLLVSIRSLLY